MYWLGRALNSSDSKAAGPRIPAVPFSSNHLQQVVHQVVQVVRVCHQAVEIRKLSFFHSCVSRSYKSEQRLTTADISHGNIFGGRVSRIDACDPFRILWKSTFWVILLKERMTILDDYVASFKVLFYAIKQINNSARTCRFQCPCIVVPHALNTLSSPHAVAWNRSPRNW